MNTSLCVTLCIVLCLGFAGEVLAVDNPVLYVGVWSGAKIYRYKIGANGTVKAQFGTALTAPGDARDMLVTPDQGHLYYAYSDLATYEITNAKGKLALVNTALIGNGSFRDLDLYGDRLYGTHSQGTGRLLVFDVSNGAPVNMGRCDDDDAPCASDADCATGTCVGRCTDPPTVACTNDFDCFGTCVPLGFSAGAIQEATTPLDPHGVVVRPDGKFAFVANGFDFIQNPPETEEISSFPINPDGTVVDGGAGYSVTDSNARPAYFAIADDPTTPGAAFLYQTESPGSDIAIAQRSDPTTGVLTVELEAVAGNGALRLTLDPDGDGLYVVNLVDDTVSAFTAEDGVLTKIDDYPTGQNPKDVLAYGGFLYVANAGNLNSPSTIAVYSIGADASLTPIQSKIIDAGSGHDQGAHRLAIFDPTLAPSLAPITLFLDKAAGATEDVELTWTEGSAAYDIYQATECPDVQDHHLDTTTATSYTHAGAPSGLSCYRVTASP